jgi:hypothetical protein
MDASHCLHADDCVGGDIRCLVAGFEQAGSQAEPMDAGVGIGGKIIRADAADGIKPDAVRQHRPHGRDSGRAEKACRKYLQIARAGINGGKRLGRCHHPRHHRQPQIQRAGDHRPIHVRGDNQIAAIVAHPVDIIGAEDGACPDQPRRAAMTGGNRGGKPDRLKGCRRIEGNLDGVESGPDQPFDNRLGFRRRDPAQNGHKASVAVTFTHAVVPPCMCAGMMSGQRIDAMSNSPVRTASSASTISKPIPRPVSALA